MFAAGIETVVIFVIISVITAIFNGFKKKTDTDDGWTSQRPPRIPRPTNPRTAAPPPVSSQKQVDWEEELRRLLQGSTPLPAPPRTPTTPPPTPVPRRQPQAPPPQPRPEPRQQSTMAVPKVFQEEKFYKGHCVNCGGHLEFRPRDMEEVVPCPHCNQLTVLRPFSQTPVETMSHQKAISTFSQGTKTWQKASALDERVTTEMANKLSQPIGSTAVASKQRSAEIGEVVGMFKIPRNARQAVIASLILAPPKALEN